jgi:hypothetical protein
MEVRPVGVGSLGYAAVLAAMTLCESNASSEVMVIEPFATRPR